MSSELIKISDIPLTLSNSYQPFKVYRLILRMHILEQARVSNLMLCAPRLKPVVRFRDLETE
jgi:hypothetical protein